MSAFDRLKKARDPFLHPAKDSTLVPKRVKPANWRVKRFKA